MPWCLGCRELYNVLIFYQNLAAKIFHRAAGHTRNNVRDSLIIGFPWRQRDPSADGGALDW